MKTATVRDLRYKFSRVEELLRDGEPVQITKRRRVIARLVPPEPAKRVRRPDFLARLKKMYGAKTLKVSGAALLAQERSRY
ncbi:MAG TPA: hypothetical protein VKU44_07225 [Terriglobia bacterium]|nr:hypothetical protein [Terriglobia bacterium]